MKSAIREATQLQIDGKFHQAANIYNRILQQDPKNVDALHLLGVVAFQCSDFKKSADLISRALAIDPSKAEIHHNLGSTLRVLGNFEEARHHYRTAISLAPDYAESYFNLSAITRFQDDSEFIDGVNGLLDSSELNESDSTKLHFAAGKYYDDVHLYEQAFEHFKLGNAARGALFDTDEYERMVERLIAGVDRETFQLLENAGLDDATPVFIVGMPRSGTSLVEQILSSHPQVFGAGELPDIIGITKAVPSHAGGIPYPECLRALTTVACQGFGGSYLKRLRTLGGSATRVVDKNPINHQHLGLIFLMLPKAKIIHCHRNPLDMSLSCYFQNFRNGQEFSYSFEGIAAYYHGYRRLMDHWSSLAPQRIIDFCYEEVVDDLETGARQLICFS